MHPNKYILYLAFPVNTWQHLFKKDVIYYTDKRGRRIDIYYDAITKHLIGYKELSRDYVAIKNTTKKIRIIK